MGKVIQTGLKRCVSTFLDFKFISLRFTAIEKLKLETNRPFAEFGFIRFGISLIFEKNSNFNYCLQCDIFTECE